MIKIGLTGGIGSGKSVIANLLQTYDMVIYTADLESKKLLENSSSIQKQLTSLLGNDIYKTSGLDRKLMASLIFNNPLLLEKVNAIVHPEVALHFKAWAEKQNAQFVVLESAILFESDFNQLMDITILVYAPQEERVRRAIIRDKTTEAEVLRRIKNQQPDEIKKELADFIIYNEGTQALLPQVEVFLNYIAKR